MIELTHGPLRARISEQGAELRSLQAGADELMWQADPAVWGQTAPLLFPVVGRLRNGGHWVGERWHELALHGFAAGERFELLSHSASSATLALASDGRADYPFAFRLMLRFTLGASGLTVAHRVRNPATTPLSFALGAHPGFALAGRLQDWRLMFDAAEAPEVWRLDSNLLATDPEPLAWGADRSLALHTGLFDRDALVFKRLRSQRISLVHRQRGPRLHLHTGGAPQLGLWARPGAPYVCIEPWHGHDDGTQAPLELRAKPQLLHLAGGGVFDWAYRIEPAGPG